MNIKMTDQELENKIKKILKTDINPDRANFTRMLNQLPDIGKEKYNEFSYIQDKNRSSINNNIANVFNIWKSKRIVLVPSLILLLIVGAFSLSPQTGQYNMTIQQLAEQNETIEEPGYDIDDQLIYTLETPAINDLSLTQNEI